MSDNRSSSNVGVLDGYAQGIELTDKIPLSDMKPILFGLFGEVGSIMATAKKRHRENSAYPEYQQALEEEFGDVLWYLTTLCRRLDIDIAEIFSEAENKCRKNVVKTDLNLSLLDLGKATSALLDIKNTNEQPRHLLCTFAHHYLRTLQIAGVTFPNVVNSNIAKVRGRFLPSDPSDLPTFDDKFPKDEQIPEHFEIKITERTSGKSYLQWNDVFIGDPLTDNSLDPDGYRFHDVFHLANAAVLHWSPVFRGLIKQKRKSDPEVDEVQDGGRASVIEEGLTSWIFSHAKNINFFDGHTTISFNTLKTVQQFVRGYEVEKCPLNLWEKAILQGYEVFRQVRDNNGGVVIGDRKTRTIVYQSINEK